MSQQTDHTKIDKAQRISFTGLGLSSLSFLIPIVSEFEGFIGDNVVMGLGGAGAVSVFVLFMRIGRITAFVGDMFTQADVELEEVKKECQEINRKDRVRRKMSNYLHDPIGWSDSELPATNSRGWPSSSVIGVDIGQLFDAKK